MALATKQDARGPAAAVLTNRRLLRQIVACMDGMPWLIYQLRSSTYDSMPLARVVREGSIRALEMLHEWTGSADMRLTSWEDATVRDAALEAVKSGKAEVAAWVLERFATPSLGPSLWRAAFSQSPGSAAVLDVLLKYFPNADVGHIRLRDTVASQWLVERGLPLAFTPYSIRAAIKLGDEQLIRVLAERGIIQDYGAAFATAIASSKWSVFFLLKEKYSEIRMMDDLDSALACAVEKHNTVVVQTVCQLSFPSPPVKAIHTAIDRGFLEIVKFFFSSYRAAFSSDQIDRAAGSGQLEVFKFLRQQDIGECSPAAIQTAASNGYLEVVRFLYEQGLNAGVDVALDNALMEQHKDVAAYLLPKCPAGCKPERGKDLLQMGFVAEWKELGRRSPYKDAELADAMRWAGSDGKLPIIRFIVDDLGRPDLGAYALEGAATLGSVAWVTALYEMTKQAPTLPALKNAIMAAGSYVSWLPKKEERLEVMRLLYAWCDDATREEAVKYAKSISYDAIVEAVKTQASSSVQGTGSTRCNCEKREEFNLKAQGLPYETADKWGIGHQTRPKLAIAQGDLAYLKKLHALVLSDPRYAEEPEMSFEDVTVAAIASGNTDIVDWILMTVYPSQADEENLLEYAVYYGQTNVAKRLLATYPKSCQLPLAGVP
ncbi:hypothetical protein P43SY_002676 [Pythium insidiosum]|uniref:Ankyrin repeat protein n=1 Tax=Pythium insidiosum TaxID=114742 RepID=A0AAD5LTW5_PYTIN|nr:hypothetical protein P43SY_002676 [Pythium insidiosum]